MNAMLLNKSGFPFEHFAIRPVAAIQKRGSSLFHIFLAHWKNLPGTAIITVFSEKTVIEPGNQPFGTALFKVKVPGEIAVGEKYSVEIHIECSGLKSSLKLDCVFPRDDHVLFIGAGYHSDPVWWNTQRDYTEIGSHQKLDTGAFIDLNRAYLELLNSDPGFSCTIETIDAIQPTWFSQPESRDWIKKFARENRLELIGSYDEPQTTLVGCELICRNIAYGIGFAEKIAGIRPKGLAQWDVFGHDPCTPALAGSAGLDWITFCRGLYHGGHLPPNENIIPSEIRWVSPDGSEHFTHYQSRHYT
ncbi:MAG TPA: hypothetical protein ENN67_01180, partial [Firmicutes bacterium]|nr:hypothetical protein [Bacillota bacterium]